ncbi:hypothetical protein KIW84_074894 [Lathyrus oleraceus]|uniref:Uncharacterized protein n=1 Tax=Pisum sativum TaxID=3888 RepID=A0A9D4VSM3_PEA|nr:hypothetical protein KIW84_074894 [Pisum sativum]
MTYAELYPSLVLKNLLQLRNPPHIPEPLPWWYKPDLRYAFHQGAPRHDTENCYPLKYEVQKLVKSGMVSFEDRAPNVKANPLPAHGNSSVNMVDGCLGSSKCSTNNNNISQRSVSLLVIRLAGPVPYVSDKAVPYQYNATMVKDGQEVPLPTTNPVVSIADVTKVTRSGRVFGPIFPKDVEDSTVGKKVEVPAVDSRVLEKAFVEHDVTVDQFDHIVANITSCNNIHFCDEELLEEGRNHNLTLHISMNCKDDTLSNVLVDTRSSLNVLPKSTLSKLSYQGTTTRYIGVIVKAFDGSRKTVIDEVDLSVKIGPSDFQITLQVMDIHLVYSCLLGRPWIHEAGAVTSTLHRKLKFMKNGKLVIVGGEKALLVSHLSSFSYVEAKDEVGNPFQALSNSAEKIVGAHMSSLKDARKIFKEGTVD